MSEYSCKLVSAIFAVPSILFLTALGLITNGFLLHFYKNKRITDKNCSQYFLIACAILDFSWNTLPVVFVIVHDTSSYLVGSPFFSHHVTERRLISHVCCFYVFCSITLFTLMAVDRVMAVRNPLASKFRTRKNILLQLCVLPVAVTLIGFLTWFWYGFYFLVYAEAILIGACYMYILREVNRIQFRSLSVMGDQHKRKKKEMSLTKVTAINTWISILICIPCTMSIMLKFPLKPYVDPNQCVPFVLMMLLHHPLMSVNYAIHPITCYLTMTSFRRHVHRVTADMAQKIGWSGLSERVQLADDRGTFTDASTKPSHFISNVSTSHCSTSAQQPQTTAPVSTNSTSDATLTVKDDEKDLMSSDV